MSLKKSFIRFETIREAKSFIAVHGGRFSKKALLSPLQEFEGQRF
jgi:hypothetical protein